MDEWKKEQTILISRSYSVGRWVVGASAYFWGEGHNDRGMDGMKRLAVCLNNGWLVFCSGADGDFD